MSEDEGTVDVAVDVTVFSGEPNGPEVAAVVAVLTEVLEELAEEQGRREATVESAWSRSQRSVRAPVIPGAGRWRSFSG